MNLKVIINIENILFIHLSYTDKNTFVIIKLGLLNLGSLLLVRI